MTEEEKPVLPEDHEALKKCLLLIEQKFGMGTHHTWTESSYKVLSNLITTASKRTVSTNTLRRLYDKVVEGDGQYLPKVETKNALAIYLGFEDWYHYIIQQSSEAHSVPNQPIQLPSQEEHLHASKPEAVQTKRGRKPINILYVWLGIAAFVLASVAFFLREKNSALGLPRYAKLDLDARFDKIQVPAAVDFKVKYNGYNPDSLRVVTHEADRGNVSLNNNYFSTRFLTPGMYPFRLYYGQQLLEERFVYINSQGWERLLITGSAAFNYPEDKTINDVLKLSESELKSLSIQLKHGLRTMYCNFGELKFDVNDFEIETRFKNQVVVNDNDCYSSKLKVLTDSAQFVVSTTRKNCGQLVYVAAGDVFKNGNVEPLHSLTVPDGYNTVKMVVKNKVMTGYINNKEAIKLPYNRSRGGLKGVVMNFEGDGKAEYIRIYDGQHKLIHEKVFRP